MPFRAIFIALIATVALLAREPVHTRHAMVVAQEARAADVGVAALAVGGNAVDAAVAMGFALAVTDSGAGNIGGGGFMLIRMADGRSTFIDFREKAPLKASRDMYLDAGGKMTRDSIVGWRASGIPGTVRGLEYAHKKFGKKPWASLVEPAVQLAGEGFSLSFAQARAFHEDSDLLSRFPDSKRILLNDGNFYQPGDKLVQPDLAATLERIRDQGARGFYEGITAHKLADAMREHGGLIALDDLKQYEAVERKPLTGRYKDFEIITAPPPSSGGIGILQMLGMLDDSGYERGGAGSASTLHYLAEVMRRFYADRSKYLADPDFVKVPVSKLLDAGYIAERRSTIDPERATPSGEIGPGKIAFNESGETTNYNVIDSEGNAVVVTYTLNNWYGSGVMAPGLGFLLNDEMDDFASKPGSPNMFGLVQGEANAIKPAKRPLSSMTPTVVLRDGKLFMVLGAPGGGRIINGVLQVFLNVADFGMNVQDAIDWPRIHHQWMPDKLYVEPGISPDTVALLKQRGYTVERTGGVARVDAILVSKDGWLEGGVDGRGPDGKAGGF